MEPRGSIRRVEFSELDIAPAIEAGSLFRDNDLLGPLNNGLRGLLLGFSVVCAFNSMLPLVVVSSLSGEGAASIATPTWSATASAFPTALLVVFGHLLEAVVLFLRLLFLDVLVGFAVLFVPSECWLTAIVRPLALILSLLLRFTFLASATFFFSRRLSLVNDDLLGKLLLKFWQVLVGLSILIILTCKNPLEPTPGEPGSLLRWLISFLLFDCSRLLLAVLLKPFKLVLSASASGGSAYLTDRSANGCLRFFSLLILVVAKLGEFSLGSDLLGLLEGGSCALGESDAVLLE
jgi:hypothetical protein